MKILLLAALAAFCDVTVEYETKNSGYRGFGASQSEGKRSVSGLKAREEGSGRFTGAVLGAFGSKKNSVTVIRVDQDKLWQIDDKKKTYKESPITLPKKEREEMEQASSGRGKEEKPTHRIKSAEAEVKNSGEKKTINGFKTTRWDAALTIVVEDLKTKETAEYVMKSGIWATPWTKDLKKAVEEEAKFAKAYAKKLGFDMGDDDGRYGMQTAAMLLAAAGPELEKAMDKLAKGMSKLDGYAIVTETQWQTPALPAAAKGKKGKEVEVDEDDALSDAASAGSLGGAAAGFLGGLAKKAAKKKAKEMAAPQPGKAAFSVRHEVKSVETGDVPESSFEIPANYKKKS